MFLCVWASLFHSYVKFVRGHVLGATEITIRRDQIVLEQLVTDARAAVAGSNQTETQTDGNAGLVATDDATGAAADAQLTANATTPPIQEQLELAVAVDPAVAALLSQSVECDVGSSWAVDGVVETWIGHAARPRFRGNRWWSRTFDADPVNFVYADTTAAIPASGNVKGWRLYAGEDALNVTAGLIRTLIWRPTGDPASGGGMRLICDAQFLPADVISQSEGVIELRQPVQSECAVEKGDLIGWRTSRTFPGVIAFDDANTDSAVRYFQAPGGPGGAGAGVEGGAAGVTTDLGLSEQSAEAAQAAAGTTAGQSPHDSISIGSAQHFSAGGLPRSYSLQARVQHANGFCRENVCVCDGGLGVIGKMDSGTVCDEPGKNVCETCEAGRHLFQGECLAVHCSCSNGVVSPYCSLEDPEKCQSCDVGYNLLSTTGKCVRQGACICEHGTPKDGEDCPGEGIAACKACDDGYFVNAIASGCVFDPASEHPLLTIPMSFLQESATTTASSMNSFGNRGELRAVEAAANTASNPANSAPLPVGLAQTSTEPGEHEEDAVSTLKKEAGVLPLPSLMESARTFEEKPASAPARGPKAKPSAPAPQRKGKSKATPSSAPHTQALQKTREKARGKAKGKKGFGDFWEGETEDGDDDEQEEDSTTAAPAAPPAPPSPTVATNTTAAAPAAVPDGATTAAPPATARGFLPVPDKCDELHLLPAAALDDTEMIRVVSAEYAQLFATGCSPVLQEGSTLQGRNCANVTLLTREAGGKGNFRIGTAGSVELKNIEIKGDFSLSSCATTPYVDSRLGIWRWQGRKAAGVEPSLDDLLDGAGSETLAFRAIKCNRMLVKRTADSPMSPVVTISDQQTAKTVIKATDCHRIKHYTGTDGVKVCGEECFEINVEVGGWAVMETGPEFCLEGCVNDVDASKANRAGAAAIQQHFIPEQEQDGRRAVTEPPPGGDVDAANGMSSDESSKSSGAEDSTSVSMVEAGRRKKALISSFAGSSASGSPTWSMSGSSSDEVASNTASLVDLISGGAGRSGENGGEAAAEQPPSESDREKQSEAQSGHAAIGDSAVAENTARLMALLGGGGDAAPKPKPSIRGIEDRDPSISTRQSFLQKLPPLFSL
eukprot:CAMPEP_0178995076 /NCGR_PEP_ID=MMETSP0795-20121207/7641_1 /TAXON_ID=88552 /ORGANISM="Amoebophrya sp., Strain Ameob2" /LENGTH=1119 /DNA_ID=CAMNT_0020687373 /DNA_START=317 /DNA_END=3676 /DNA_ORIENTATION=-